MNAVNSVYGRVPPAGSRRAWTAVLTAAGLAGAVVVGVLMAHRLPLGAAAVAAVVYGLIVLRSPALGLALWVPALSLSFFPAGNALLRAGVAAAILAIAVSHLRSRGEPAPIWRHGGWLAATALLLGWAVASTIWALHPGAAGHELLRAGLAVFVAVALITVFATRRHAEWLVAAIVAGPVLSALIGLVGGNAVERYAGGNTFGRLAGGSGDANQLAAGLVPAIALAIGLAAGAKDRRIRWAAIASVPIAVIGIAASESRGGVIALGVLIVGLLLFLRGGRTTTFAVLAVTTVAAGAFVIGSPGVLTRITDLNADGTGRADLWRVAEHMSADHPFGVGLDGFRQEASNYALNPGMVERIYQLVDRPVVVHNTYLQLMAELGFVGLLLFAGVVIASLRAGVLAARRFTAQGEEGLAIVARASVIALIGFLVAATFVSFGFSNRMWALLAVGPVLLSAAHAGRAGRDPAS